MLQMLRTQHLTDKNPYHLGTNILVGETPKQENTQNVHYVGADAANCQGE